MESHSVTCHSTQVNTPRFNSSQRLVFNLSTPEGWKAELTSVTGYMSRSLFGYNQSISQKKLCSAMCHKRIRGLYLSTDLTACGRESNLQPINHMSDILVPFIFPYSLDWLHTDYGCFCAYRILLIIHLKLYQCHDVVCLCVYQGSTLAVLVLPVWQLLIHRVVHLPVQLVPLALVRQRWTASHRQYHPADVMWTRTCVTYQDSLYCSGYSVIIHTFLMSTSWWWLY